MRVMLPLPWHSLQVLAHWLLLRQPQQPGLDGSEVLHGQVGLKQADARLLGLSFQGLSRDERLWRDVSRDSKEEELPDWNVPGPRTASWCIIKFLNRRNGGPTDRHCWRTGSNNLQPDSWGVGTYEHLMKVVDENWVGLMAWTFPMLERWVNFQVASAH